MTKHLLAALAALTLAAPIAAQAQVVPSYATSYATPEEDVHGRVVSFDGAYTLTVRDERGYLDNVELHDGTIINPTGLTLEPGMIVNVLGYDAGSYLAANEIDTPYTFYNGEPCFQGRVWSYWGPSVDFAFFFGNLAWWHGSYFTGSYAWNGGVRVYNNVTYKTVYRDVTVDRDNNHPIPVDKPPTYHKPIPIPVDNKPPTDHGITRVNENPVPLANHFTANNGGESRRIEAPARQFQAPARQAQAPARQSKPAPENHDRR